MDTLVKEIAEATSKVIFLEDNEPSGQDEQKQNMWAIKFTAATTREKQLREEKLALLQQLQQQQGN
jgi:hypothetical protein